MNPERFGRNAAGRVAWAVDLYAQCRQARVPFFFKQGSALRPGEDDELPGYEVVKEWPDD